MTPESERGKRGEAKSTERRLGLHLVATLGPEMGILEENLQDLERTSVEASRSCTAELLTFPIL